MLEVFDTEGQEEYTALRDQWIRGGKGFVLVYSIASRSSFARVKRFHHQVQRVKESASYGRPPVPIMLVGNQSDRVTEREVATSEGYALARELGCEFVEASEKNGINVEAFLRCGEDPSPTARGPTATSCSPQTTPCRV